MIRSDALRRRERRQALLTVVFTIISVLYLMPVFLVLINSLKANAFVNTETFKLPTAESFVGLKNYVKGMTFGNFAFYKVVFYSFFITITSTALILVCTSMAAWYISRVGSLVSKIVYYLCVFSMVVPFQMVMYTLARTADQMHLNTPWTIPVIYLGFGAGLAVFMFTGVIGLRQGVGVGQHSLGLSLPPPAGGQDGLVGRAGRCGQQHQGRQKRG